MNDKTTTLTPRPMPGLRAAMCWALVLSSMISSPLLAAQTDISTAPITSTNAAQVKPNIMLLMDTSYSMGRTHMPDEMETNVGIRSIGYKAAQCNAVYYNPTLVYALPKKADGSLFPAPSFTSAMYDGFSSTTSYVNLASAFQAYDTHTLETSGYNDTPQAAYYYVKTGGTVPIVAYNSTPCTDDDVNASITSSDNGAWTRVTVGAGEQANFAVWYSYYRTRILLIKSAASLAFTPLTDSFRVGFITVKPKDNPTDAAINRSKYLPIDDFTTVQRGLWFDKLFSQVPEGSSPTREGLARVGRHYAGMHDGINQGMPEDPVQYSCQQNFTIMTTDGYWNVADESTGLSGLFIGGPVDMSGQHLVASATVNPDGNLDAPTTNHPLPAPAADFNGTPRPIWDGTFTGLRTVRTKTVHNEYQPCGAYFSMVTSQLSISTTQAQTTTSQTRMATSQNRQSTSQNLQSTTQTVKSTSQPTQSTFQTLKSTHQILKTTTQRLQATSEITQRTLQNLAATNQNRASTYQNLQSVNQAFIVDTHTDQTVYIPQQSTSQVLQSTSQLLKSTSQLNQQSVQNLQSTQQNFFTDSYTTMTTSQTTTATSQMLQHTAQVTATTSQMLQRTEQTTQTQTQMAASTLEIDQSTAQIQLTSSQVYQSTAQVRSCNARGENCTPGPVGSCVPSDVITCSPVNTAPKLVDSCTNDPASMSNNWVATTCDVRSGAATPTTACTPQSASPGNGHTTITCDTKTSGPTAVAGCTPFSANAGNAYTTTSCANVARGPNFVASCTASGPTADNGYVATTCAPNTVGPVGVQTCAGQTPTSTNNYVSIVCGTNNTPDVGVASCTPAAADSGNSWTATICTPVGSSNQPVPSCTDATPGPGNGYTTTTCTPNNSTDQAVASCTPVAASSGNYWTATVCTPSNTSTPTGSCTPISPTSGNFYTTTSCPTINGTPTIVNDSACTPATGGDANQWTTTTCTPFVSGPNPYAGACFADFTSGVHTYHCSSNNTSNVPVLTCAPSGPLVGNGYTTTTCSNNNSALTPTDSCTPVAATSLNFYTAITCPTLVTTDVGTDSCADDPTPNASNHYLTTSCRTATSTDVPVPTCAVSPASSGNSYLDTQCRPVTTSNVAVNSCTPQTAAGSNGWVTITCPAEVLDSGPTKVATCIAAPATDGNGHRRTDCNTVIDRVAVPPGSCVPEGPNAGNNYTTRTCSTTSNPNIPVLSCTPAAASADNSWQETDCGTNNNINFAVGTCTATPASADNAWTRTDCLAPVTTPPTPAPTCNNDPATLANGWTSTSCTTSGDPVAGVQACTDLPATTDNQWTATICGTNNHAAAPVQTCTDSGPTSGNGWTTTTCSDNNSVAQPAASCATVAPTSLNNWTTVSCPTPVDTTNVPAQSCIGDGTASAFNLYTTTTCTSNNVPNTPSNSCVPSAPTADNNWTLTTCPTLTTGPTGTDTCMPTLPASDNGWLTTTCAPHNTTDVGVATCTASDSTSGNGYTTTTCRVAATTNVAVATCSTGSPTAVNGYTTTTCNPLTTDVPAGTCTPSSPTADNGYVTTTCPVIVTVIGVAGSGSCTPSGPTADNQWTTTTCPGAVSTGPTPTASCVPTSADSTNGYTQTTCSTLTSTPAVVTSCNPIVAGAGNAYTSTTCTPLTGDQLAVTTYTRTQVFNISGDTQTNSISDSTTTDGPTVAGACYAPFTQPMLPADGYATWTSADATAYPSCTGWPCKVDVDSGSPRSLNSLADVAQYYYVNDLRTAANEPRGPDYYRDDVPSVGSTAEDDKARWQHMTTFGVALGVSGTLNYRTDYKTATTGDFADIRTGAQNWPLWPDPTPNYYNDPGNYNDPRSIDDFWHAAVNGRGIFFSAANPTSVIAGLSGALAGINSRVASSTGAGVSNLNPVSGDNFVYLANYTTQKWSGDVQAHTIDVASGLINTPVIWSAQSLIDATTGNLCDNRTIKLFHAGATNNLTDFSWSTSKCDLSGNPAGSIADGLSSAEQANFGALNVSLLSQYPSMNSAQRAAAPGSNLVNFLRGQRGLENFTAGASNELYRQRDHVLGDIVDGSPVYVRAPFASYTDTGYAAFKTANSGRTPMLYVPANDGMLHAFYAGTSEADPQGGKEAWAVIPSVVLPNLYKLADANYKNVHQYYVDGTPTVSDIYDGSAWKTLLVGGLNDGGRGFYALDVTDPLNPKGMWEFNWSDTCYNGNVGTAGADCQIGLSFGHPLVTKLSSGRWVVLVTSGYNNVNATPKAGDGVGYLYVLDAVTGQILYKISTNVGDATTPSGLAQINNFVDKADINNLTVRVYGTDTLGNIWRFDVNDNTAPSGREATLVGTAKDSAGIPQPITTRPELTSVGDNPMLFVATGKLLGATDVADVQTQTIYGIVDPVTPTVAYSNLRSSLAPLTMTQVGSGTGAYRTINCTGTTAQCASTAGWRVDLPDLGERVNVEMKLRDQVLVVGSNVPQISACSAGGYSWLNYLSYQSGLAVTTSPGLSVSEQVANSLIVGLTVVIIGTDTVKAIVTTSDAGVLTRTIPTPTAGGKARRVSWREVIAQ